MGRNTKRFARIPFLTASAIAAPGAAAQIDLRVVAAEGDPVPGTPYTIGEIPTERAVITDAGYIFFDAWTADEVGDERYTTLAVVPGGGMHVVARDESNVRGLPAGVILPFHGQGEIIPDRSDRIATLNIGQTELLWTTDIRLPDGTNQNVWLEWNEQDGTSVFLELDEIIALDGQPWEVRVDRPDVNENTAQFDEVGGRAFRMRLRAPGSSDSRLDAVVRWTGADGFEPVLIEGGPWNDLGEGGVVTEVGNFTLNRDGSAFIRAVVDPPKGRANEALLLVRPDGTTQTGPLADQPLLEIPGAFVFGDPINSGVDFGSIAQLVTFDDLQGTFGTAIVQRRSDGTQRLLVRDNFADPRLPDGQVITKYASLPRTDGLGNVLIEVFLGDGPGQFTRQGVLGFTTDDEVQELIFVGDTLPDGSAVRSFSTRVDLTVMPSAGGITSISGDRLLDDPASAGAAWAWDGTTVEAYAYPGAPIPGPQDPTASGGYRPILESLAVEANGDIVFDAWQSHGDGLRVRSADGAVRLLTFEDQRWNVAHGGADMPVREPVPAGTRGFGLSLRLQHEGPDAVGADTSVLMYWERESDGGDVLTLVTPDRCPADTNDDGTVTPADFKAWTRAYNAEFPACDQNGDGLCNPADFNAWVANFNAGCP